MLPPAHFYSSLSCPSASSSLLIQHVRQCCCSLALRLNAIPRGASVLVALKPGLPGVAWEPWEWTSLEMEARGISLMEAACVDRQGSSSSSVILFWSLTSGAVGLFCLSSYLAAWGCGMLPTLRRFPWARDKGLMFGLLEASILCFDYNFVTKNTPTGKNVWFPLIWILSVGKIGTAETVIPCANSGCGEIKVQWSLFLNYN